MYLIMEVTNMLLVKQATRRKARELVAKYLLIRCWNDQTWSVSIGFHLVTFSNPIVFLLISLFSNMLSFTKISFCIMARMLIQVCIISNLQYHYFSLPIQLHLPVAKSVQRLPMTTFINYTEEC